MNSLDVFDGVPIPLDLAAIGKYVTLGASDSGKTYMLARFAEQLAKAGGFFVLLDPVGKHWSLRAGPDGTPEGGIDDVWVLGGLHGDVPLDPASGALIADTVVDHPGRYVIDTSAFETDQDVYNFAAAFAKRLFRRKMRDAGWPLLLMLEESESFIPQVAQEGQKAMKGAFGRIVRQGRNHGLGVFLVFQRSAAGDKGAISQCKVLIAKRASHKRDRDAIDNWVEANGTQQQRDELMGALASLEVEEAYVWDPSWLKVFARTKVRRRETFDSSANVKHGEKMTKVELVPLDVEDLGEKMKEVAEKAVEEDPKRLQKKIVDLESQLARLDGIDADVTAAEAALLEAQQRIVDLEGEVAELKKRPAEQIIREVPAITEGDLAGIWDIGDDLAAAAGALNDVRDLVQGALSNGAVVVEQRQQRVEAVSGVTDGDGGNTRAEHPLPPAPPRRALDPDTAPTKPQIELIEAYAAFFPRAASPAQLGILLAKSYNAGPFRGAIAAVHEMGYVEDGRATEKARALAGPVSLPSPEQIQQRWRARLSGTKLKIFETALEAYPHAASPEEIGAAIGKNPNAGPIRGMMNDLAAWQLVTYDKATGIRASDYLFDLFG
jgi:hypothetical protein